MDSDKRPMCKYSPNCYQKNPDHLKKFKHAPGKYFDIFNFAKNKKRMLEEDIESSEKSEINENEEPKCSVEHETKLPKISNTKEECINKKRYRLSTEDDYLKDENVKKLIEQESTEIKLHNISNSTEQETTTIKYHDIPENIDSFIQKKFLVSMPLDFYKFWEFYQKNRNISECINKIQLKLVGPFDILQGKLLISENDDDYLLHWRHFYDPPEFQTILMSTEDEFHMGYFRDSPSEKEVLVASNNGMNCKIQIVAENIFGALVHYINTKLKEINNVFLKSQIDTFLQDLKKFANENKFTLETNSQGMKKRLKLVVAKTFHGAGIVVPYNKKTQLGYRPLVENDDVIKKLLKKLVEATTEKEQNTARSSLQHIITMATIANDESDFGTGLELGIDLFCYGESILNSYVGSFLSIAYNMLDREPFEKIIKAHLKNRRKGGNLSIASLVKN